MLHAFQKNSPKGLKTTRRDVELIGRRLRLAQQHHEDRYGNVFADLGLSRNHLASMILKEAGRIGILELG